MVDLNETESILANVNGLKNPIKRGKFSDWIEKTVW